MFLLLTVFFPHIIHRPLDSGAVRLLLVYLDFMQKFNQRPTLACTGGVVVGIGGDSERVKAVLQISRITVNLFFEVCNVCF